MKRRHPKQVMDHTMFRPGDRYAMIRAVPDRDPQTNAPDARISCETLTFAAALDNGDIGAAEEALSRHPAEDREIRLTTHAMHGRIVVATWGFDGALLDKWDFDGMDDRDFHSMLLLAAAWDADPRLHVVDWLNPDDVCEVAGLSWTEEEATLNRRRDAAMRKKLGFD